MCPEYEQFPVRCVTLKRSGHYIDAVQTGRQLFDVFTTVSKWTLAPAAVRVRGVCRSASVVFPAVLHAARPCSFMVDHGVKLH